MDINKVTVEVANPLSIRLKVTAELSIGEWRELLKRTEKVPYYGPLADLLDAIENGILTVTTREEINL